MSESEKTANLIKLLDMVKARLHSKGKRKANNPFGLADNVEYVDVDIYSTEMLMTFLQMSLSDFNSTPYFTFYTFEDSKIINQFASLLVEGAVMYALGSQALIERGREFSYTDNGIATVPPSVSELLQTQYSELLQIHYEKLKHVKQHIKEIE